MRKQIAIFAILLIFICCDNEYSEFNGFPLEIRQGALHCESQDRPKNWTKKYASVRKYEIAGQSILRSRYNCPISNGLASFVVYFVDDASQSTLPKDKAHEYRRIGKCMIAAGPLTTDAFPEKEILRNVILSVVAQGLADKRICK